MKDLTESAFPSEATPGLAASHGMTYKQWLVGQILSGLSGLSTQDVSPKDTVAWARQLAEEAVRQDREA